MYRSYTNRNFWTPSLEEADTEWLMRKLGTRIVIVDYDCLADEDDVIDYGEYDALLRFEQYTDWPIVVFCEWYRQRGARALAEQVGFKCVIDRWRHPAVRSDFNDAWWISFAWQLCRFSDPYAAEHSLVISPHIQQIVRCMGTGVSTLFVTPTEPTVYSVAAALLE